MLLKLVGLTSSYSSSSLLTPEADSFSTKVLIDCLPGFFPIILFVGLKLPPLDDDDDDFPSILPFGSEEYSTGG